MRQFPARTTRVRSSRDITAGVCMPRLGPPRCLGTAAGTIVLCMYRCSLMSISVMRIRGHTACRNTEGIIIVLLFISHKTASGSFSSHWRMIRFCEVTADCRVVRQSISVTDRGKSLKGTRSCPERLRHPELPPDRWHWPRIKAGRAAALKSI